MAADPNLQPKVHLENNGDLFAVASGGSIVCDVGSTVTFNGTVTSPIAGAFQATSPTVPFGYGTGAGGSATQSTNRSTSITLNTVCGQITTDTTSLAAAGEAEFKVANSAVGANDVVVINTISGGKGTPFAFCSGLAAGAFSITLTNLHASEADTAASKLNFVVIKGVTS